MTRSELVAVAKGLGIKGISRMNMAQLQEAITNGIGSVATLPGIEFGTNVQPTELNFQSVRLKLATMTKGEARAYRKSLRASGQRALAAVRVAA